MYVRAIALAIPLALGLAACKTSHTQSESGRTATTEPSRTSTEQSTATATPSQPGAEASASTSGTAGEATASGSTQGGVSGSTSGAYGSGAGAMTPPAHSDDQTVTGKVTRVSERSVAIKSDMGEEKTLDLVPQTMVKVDGQDATRTELKEGQEVRASFNQVEGRDVAVQIEAREATSTGGSGSTMMPGSSTGTGTDSGSMPGSTGTDSTGSSGATGTGSGTPTTPSPDTK
jgi:Cu/Ag efflux protein CusF